MHDFSVLGLRTLLMTVKVMSEDEYREFENNYNGLATAENREA